MIEGDIFLTWLDNESEQVAAKLNNNETLNTEDKLVMVLKAQTNHFHHLDVELRNEVKELRLDTTQQIRELREDTTQQFRELREDTTQQIRELREDTDKRFEQVDKRFEQTNAEIKNIYRAINGQTWKMISAVGLIVILSKVVELFQF